MAAVAVGVAAFRVANALFVRGAFDPDEYWQSLEVAYWLVFGEGQLTWEWREGARIRGFLHPSLFAALYWALRVTGLDSRWAVAWAPRILQGLLAAAADGAVYALAARSFGSGVAKWALAASLSSWFVAYAGVRTYSNCLEALVVALAFAARPETTRGWGALGLLLGTGALVRPTTLLFAVPLAARPLLERREARVVALVIGVGMALSVGIVLDSAIYGALTVTPLNFLRVNLLSGVSAAYGVHVWHWYASEAMPALVGPWLLPLIAWIAHGGATSMSREAWWPVAAALLSLAVLSVSPHKELRFALPALYLVLPLCGKAAHALHDRLVVKAAGGSRGRGLFWLGAAIVLACNVGAAFFFARVHQVGTIDVMERISERAALRGEDGHRYEVELLMPCHSTPLFSHAHSADPLRRALLRTLDCSPDLALRSRNATESASFESNPLAFVARRYATVPLPDAIVVFDTHADALKAWLRGSGFELRDTLFHAMLGEHRQVLYWERTAIAPR